MFLEPPQWSPFLLFLGLQAGKWFPENFPEGPRLAPWWLGLSSFMCQAPLTPHVHQKRNGDLFRKQETSSVTSYFYKICSFASCPAHWWITYISFPDLRM